MDKDLTVIGKGISPAALLTVKGRSPRTTEAYRGYMNRYVSWAAEAGVPVTAATFSAYLAELKRNGASGAVYNGALAAGRKAILEAARRSGATAAELAVVAVALGSIKSVRIGPPAIKVVSPEERGRLLASLPPRMAMVARFLYSSGARVSEALAVRLVDIRRDGDTARVRLLGKGDKERVVLVPYALVQEARELYAGEEYLLEARTGGAFSRQYISREIARAGKRVLGRNVTAHQLRHSRASDLVRETGKLTGVSRMLGHSSVSTTARFYVDETLSAGELFVGGQ